jgi:hypothetical protein
MKAYRFDASAKLDGAPGTVIGLRRADEPAPTPSISST